MSGGALSRSGTADVADRSVEITLILAASSSSLGRRDPRDLRAPTLGAADILAVVDALTMIGRLAK